MIARSLRLRDPADFQRVRRRGRSWTTPHLVLVTLPNRLPHNRYGFAVGRRVGNAARRNRVKRWMREAIRARHDDFQTGFDVVLIARGPMADASTDFSIVNRSVGILAERSDLIETATVSADRSDQPQ